MSSLTCECHRECYHCTQAHIRSETEASLCRVCGEGEWRERERTRPWDTERPAGEGAGAGQRSTEGRNALCCHYVSFKSILRLIGSIVSVVTTQRETHNNFPARISRVIQQSCWGWHCSHSISNTFHWGSMGGKIEKWRQFEQSPRQSQHKVRISWIYFIIIKHRTLEEMYLRATQSKIYIYSQLSWRNRMIKSYFELEITSCLMFIVSRPQKEYLFLKYIKNTSSSYSNAIKTVFKSFAFKAQFFYNSLTLCRARADLSVSV